MEDAPAKMSTSRKNSAAAGPYQALLWNALDEALQQRYGKGLQKQGEEAGIHSPSWNTPIQVAPTEDDTRIKDTNVDLDAIVDMVGSADDSKVCDASGNQMPFLMRIDVGMAMVPMLCKHLV
ncbi:unnamed protein product [Nippostrongylus brasiliensis]|uniref:Eukaryotic/viral aspartic protease n=1 Tax=Nippostrongylus brasiliensis TaxID=27835 RepID=A0A0N4Y263_NIPBR|nr:unnamed protein product [Nippostrongylus brasiliensis]